MDDKALIYIPNMPVMEIDGVRVKWHSPVTTHRLNKLGEKSKYAGGNGLENRQVCKRAWVRIPFLPLDNSP